MSRERELLKEVLSIFDRGFFSYSYCKVVEDIKELLAQPSALEKVIEIRDIQGRVGIYDQDYYMLGVYNGLELAVSILENEREPQYKTFLNQPEQEVVVYQYRTKPNWIDKWYNWENCSKESYEDYKRVPVLHDWLYETRELYLKPTEQPEQEPFFQKTYYADECAYISEDLYEKLNEDTTIPIDEHNLTVGVFEVTINWREE